MVLHLCVLIDFFVLELDPYLEYIKPVKPIKTAIKFKHKHYWVLNVPTGLIWLITTQNPEC